MVIKTKEEILELAKDVSRGLAPLYGNRLKGVYLYGSYARGDAREDSDVDIAAVLDRVEDRFQEHERVGDLLSDLSLESNLVITFPPVPERDFQSGKYSVYRAIRREGIAI